MNDDAVCKLSFEPVRTKAWRRLINDGVSMDEARNGPLTETDDEEEPFYGEPGKFSSATRSVWASILVRKRRVPADRAEAEVEAMIADGRLVVVPD